MERLSYEDDMHLMKKGAFKALISNPLISVNGFRVVIHGDTELEITKLEDWYKLDLKILNCKDKNFDMYIHTIFVRDYTHNRQHNSFTFIAKGSETIGEMTLEYSPEYINVIRL